MFFSSRNILLKNSVFQVHTFELFYISCKGYDHIFDWFGQVARVIRARYGGDICQRIIAGKCAVENS